MPALIAYSLGSSLIGAVTSDPRALPRPWIAATAALSFVLMLMLARHADLAMLAGLPCLFFASMTDLRVHAAPFRMTGTLAAAGLIAEVALKPHQTAFIAAWALFGAAAILTTAYEAPWRRVGAAGAACFAIGALWHVQVLLIAISCLLLLTLSYRASYSEGGFGLGDLIPSMVLCTSLGPTVGLRLIPVTTILLCVWALIVRVRAGGETYVPVLPAFLASYIFFAARIPLF